MMNNIRIRRASLADAQTLTEFNVRLAAESENLTLDPEIVASGVKNLLNDSSRGFYWVAEQDQQVIASLMITFEWSDWRDGNFWWIQSVYVHEGYRRRGVYRHLYDHVLAQARETGGVCGLRLYVEKDNTTAQQAYANLGMIDSCYKVFETKIKPRTD